ncbi:MAG TPA: two-component regulator propeller domain-containing protein [Saprospiraceae bacterium]|nr:two-component regulator propeller domain-containing protein [Saprospiraceae bacterium]
MPKPTLSFTVCLFLLALTHLPAQTPLLEHLGAPEGLSQGMIYDLIQDRRGYLWFSTKDGLNRYDGYHFQAYHNDPFQPFSLSDNEVQALLEDRSGRIWCGTVNNGINIFDPVLNRFYHLNKLSSQDISCFSQSADGAVWAGSGSGIFRIELGDIPTDAGHDLNNIARVETFHWEKLAPLHGSAGNRVVDLHYTPDGKMWVSTFRMIGYFDLTTRSFFKVWDTPPDNDLFNNTSYFKSGPDGALWIGQAGQLMRMKDGQTTHFKLPEKSPYPYTNLVFDAQGHLYISTRKQIYKFENPSSVSSGQAVFQLLHRFPETGVIGSTRMCMDRSGILWIGTNGYGVYKYNPGNRHFYHYLAGKSPRRIVADARGRIWVWLADKAFGYLSGDTHNDLISEYDILEHDLISDGQQHLWMLGEHRSSARGDGVLIRWNEETLREEARYELPMVIGVFSRIHRSKTGKFWILGNKSVLGSFDPATGRCDTVSFSHITGFKELSLAFLEEPDGSIWMGTPHGLLHGKPEGKGMTFQRYKTSPPDRQSMNCNSVLCLLNDPVAPEHFLWIGTKGGGLSRLDKATGRFTHFTEQDGLPNNVVYGIMADSGGALWLSTNRGLSRFHPDKKLFQNFFSADGLQDDEFNTVSYAQGADGRFWFGGVNGITAFYPMALLEEARSPDVRINRLRINNQLATVEGGWLQKSLEETSVITLAHDQNQVTFEFAAMDFAAPHMNQFRYRLVGASETWVEPTVSHTATFAHLEPGTYTFQVESGGSKGIWSGKIAQLTVEILPPWYRTYWAYGCFCILALGGLWSVYRFQVNRAQLRNKLVFEQREAHRLAELDRIKTNFFNSVTHEFRTPLTLMIEPVRQMLQEVKDQSSRYRLELVDRNARRLLQYVNQLLDLSKLDAGQMPLDARPTLPAQATRAAAEPFLPMAEQKKITLILELPENGKEVLLDTLVWEQVVSNLLSNALKFTDSGGSVTLKLSITEQPSDALVRLVVKDTGIGISPEELPRIFDRFYQTEHGRGGTGIGLALSKELAERMGGNILAESVPGQGTTFRVLVHLPYAPSVQHQVAEKPGAALLAPEQKNNMAEKPLLLLIEDDPDLRLLLRASLPMEYRIAEAANGMEGIQMALELVPDLIISDWVMPEKTGLDVAETLKKNPTTSHIPLILLTAKSGADARVRGLEYGADIFLSKPFRADELTVQVRNLLASRERLRAHFSQFPNGNGVEESTPHALPAKEHEFLQRLVKVIEENLDNEAMDADGFARAMFLSRSQLHRKIHALTGLSLTEFVRNYRLDRAKEMLARREGSISEVAWRTGFPNAKYFSTCFKERFGVTPSALLNADGTRLER